MRGVAAQALSVWQPASETTQAFQHFFCARLSSDSHGAVILHQIYLIAFLQAKLAHHLGRQADGKRIAPSCNLHIDLHKNDSLTEMYIQTSGKASAGVESCR